jgi:NADH-dependent peroxiredoxin subunit F
MRDLLIIGGGAAGFAAAAYALDKQLDMELIAEQSGGQATWHRRLVAQHTAGQAVIDLLQTRVRQQSDLVFPDTVTAITKADGVFHVMTRHHGQVAALAVLVATGVTPRPLAVAGGHTLLGYGLGYSAATHAHTVRNKVVAAVGATTRAMRGVNELSRLAKHVYWIGPGLQALVSPLGMGLQYRHNVQVFEGYRVVEVLGAEHVEALLIEREGELRRLAVDGVFVDLGLQPNSTLVKDLVGLDAEGFIPVTDGGTTALLGLFAAGDVTTDFSEQLLVAVGQGACAAVSAYDYILSHRVER